MSTLKLKEEDGEIVLCFGKHAGKRLSSVRCEDPFSLQWMGRTLGGEAGDFLRGWMTQHNGFKRQEGRQVDQGVRGSMRGQTGMDLRSSTYESTPHLGGAK